MVNVVIASLFGGGGVRRAGRGGRRGWRARGSWARAIGSGRASVGMGCPPGLGCECPSLTDEYVRILIGVSQGKRAEVKSSKVKG